MHQLFDLIGNHRAELNRHSTRRQRGIYQPGKGIRDRARSFPASAPRKSSPMVLGDALYGPMFDNPQPATARPLRWLYAPFHWLTTIRFRSAAFASPRGRRSFANALVSSSQSSSRGNEAQMTLK